MYQFYTEASWSSGVTQGINGRILSCKEGKWDTFVYKQSNMHTYVTQVTIIINKNGPIVVYQRTSRNKTKKNPMKAAKKKSLECLVSTRVPIALSIIMLFFS